MGEFTEQVNAPIDDALPRGEFGPEIAFSNKNVSKA